MKSVLFILAMLSAGAVAGYAWTRAELGPYGQTPAGIGLDLPKQGGHALPRVEIQGGSTYEFGTMNFGSKLSHAFRVKNVGEAPLKLSVLATSCRCTLAATPNDLLPPGQETTVELEWKATERHGPYSQTATLETNDPRQPRVILGVSGTVVGTYIAQPTEVIFTKVAHDKAATGEFFVYCYANEPLAPPTDVAWKNTENAQFFKVDFIPLTSEELKRDDHPRSGYRGAITVSPGQPTGDFRQTLECNLDLPEKPHVAIEIRGTIAGRGSVTGTNNWDSEHKIYDMGSIARGKEARTEGLSIILRGDQRAELKLTSTEHAPKYLRTEFGTPEYLADRDQTHIPLTVIVPADAPAEAHLGGNQGKVGRLAIDPGLPDQPRLRLGVRFSTE